MEYKWGPEFSRAITCLPFLLDPIRAICRGQLKHSVRQLRDGDYFTKFLIGKLELCLCISRATGQVYDPSLTP
jgi:hypothetical protein